DQGLPRRGRRPPAVLPLRGGHHHPDHRHQRAVQGPRRHQDHWPRRPALTNPGHEPLESTSDHQRAGGAMADAAAAPEVRVIGIRGIPMVQPGDDLAEAIVTAAEAQGTPLQDGDVVAVTQRVVSKVEGRVVPLDTFEPSPFALAYAERTEKDPCVVEAVLRES